MTSRAEEGPRADDGIPVHHGGRMALPKLT